jgi:hypothetical protein
MATIEVDAKKFANAVLTVLAARSDYSQARYMDTNTLVEMVEQLGAVIPEDGSVAYDTRAFKWSDGTFQEINWDF